MKYIIRILRKLLMIAVWLITFVFVFAFVLNVFDKGFLLIGLFLAILLPFIPVSILNSMMSAPFNERLKEIEKEFNLKYKPENTLKELEKLESQAVSEADRQKISAMRYEVLYEDERYEQCLEIAKSWHVDSSNYKRVAEHLADLYLKIDRCNDRPEKWRTYEVENINRTKPEIKGTRVLIFFLVYGLIGVWLYQQVKTGSDWSADFIFPYIMFILLMIFLLITSMIQNKNNKTYLAEKLICVIQEGIDLWYVHRMLHLPWNQLKSVEQGRKKEGKYSRDVYLIAVKNEGKLIEMLDEQQLKEYEKSKHKYGVSGLYIESVSRSADMKMNIHAMRLYYAGKERNKYEEFGDLLW